MTARLWHLVRTEVHAHRGVLGLWLLTLASVAMGAITNIWIRRNLTWPEQIHFEGTFLGSLLTWNTNNIGSMDAWLWFAAGLLAAWIWLADPLQSPTAFWATRPVRVPELMLARTLLCLAVLVLLPALLAVCASLVGGFSLRDACLSALSFGLVKAGLVPLAFLVGVFWPAPGKRWLALLPALGWWVGLMCWRAFPMGDTDFGDHSWTFVLLWVAALLLLLTLTRFRRRSLLQGAFAVGAFALVWITITLKHRLEEPGWQSAQSAKLPALRISGTPQSFEFLRGKSAAEQRIGIKVKLHVDGLPPDAAAILSATQLVAAPGGGTVPAWPLWQSRSLIADTWYAALAHVMNVRPENFPDEWRNEQSVELATVPVPMFEKWADHQTVTITGKVRVRLMRLHEQWRGTYHKSLQEWPGALRLHGAVAEISNRDGEVRWTRPWVADAIAQSDTSAQGILFNTTRTSWILAFQPPQKKPDGSYTREVARMPPLWAIGEYEGPSHYSSNGGDWLRTDSSTATLSHNRKPEFVEITRDGGGLDGLPAVLIRATEFAEIEMPIEPLVLTRQQILETRKISPAKP
jgi:hypothetical protein